MKLPFFTNPPSAQNAQESRSPSPASTSTSIFKRGLLAWFDVDRTTASEQVAIHAPMASDARSIVAQTSAPHKAGLALPARLTPHTISKLPHLPAELSLAILDQAALNPLELMALITTGAASDAPHSLQHLASLNRYWSKFTSTQDRMENAAEGVYARAFIARYQAMTPETQTLLSDFWAGKAPGKAALEYVAPALRADPDIVMAAVSQNDGLTLYRAASALRADPCIVMAAVSQNGWALVYAASALRADPGIVMAAVSQSGWALERAAPALRADPDIVMAAVSQEGEALEYAAPALRADPDIVMAAVSQHGLALQYAAPALRANPDIVMLAVSQEGEALEYAASALRADPDIVMAAVSQHGLALQYAAPALCADPGIVMAAVKKDGWALEWAAPALQADPELIRIASRR